MFTREERGVTIKSSPVLRWQKLYVPQTAALEESNHSNVRRDDVDIPMHVDDDEHHHSNQVHYRPSSPTSSTVACRCLIPPLLVFSTAELCPATADGSGTSASDDEVPFASGALMSPGAALLDDFLSDFLTSRLFFFFGSSYAHPGMKESTYNRSAWLRICKDSPSIQSVAMDNHSQSQHLQRDWERSI